MVERGQRERSYYWDFFFFFFLLWWLNTWICNVQEKRFFHLKNKNVFRLIGVLFHSLHFLFKTIPNNKIYGKHFPPKQTKHCHVWMMRIRNTKATLHVGVPIYFSVLGPNMGHNNRNRLQTFKLRVKWRSLMNSWSNWTLTSAGPSVLKMYYMPTKMHKMEE